MELREDGENRGSTEGRQTKGIERVEHGVNGRQTEGVEAMEDTVEGRQATVSEKMEDGGERRQARGSRQSRLDSRGDRTEDQKKPMVWACARQ